MNWDDLRIVMAVHECGSYAAAGERLRIDESTVARRLARLQRNLGLPLFEAVDGVRRPTAQGEEILAQVAQIARHVERIAEVERPGEGPVGQIRIAATPSVAVGVLAPELPAFLSAHPGLTLQVLTSTENVNFSRWQADLAVRLMKPEKGDFLMSKLGELRLYAVAPAETEPAESGTESESGPLVCAYPEDLDLTPESRHLAAAGLLSQARCVTKNVLVVQAMLRSRTCCGILPEFLCAEFLDDPGLTATPLEETREAWLLVQAHLKQDPAARAVIDWVRGCFAQGGG